MCTSIRIFLLLNVMQKISQFFFNSIFLIFITYQCINFIFFSEFFFVFWWGLCLTIIVWWLFSKNSSLRTFSSWWKYSVTLVLLLSLSEKFIWLFLDKNAIEIFYNLTKSLLHYIDFIFRLFKHFYYYRMLEGTWDIFTIWPSIFLIWWCIGSLIVCFRRK